ncbi:Eukaryotic translation initiation factor 3 subunit M [Lecanosticta acicola]|uniref:Eukaryotic translation initiation factor 3 subunit M n=1 Tax=Lecanosticta acicola TaxID=111012 RepID=A0AAI8YZ01_9PEZI|nr:Eukaryotic translation initiation factor 3 subunit M [Lecanosticta acicola]
MPGAPNLTMVEGSFEELATEFATYLNIEDVPTSDRDATLKTLVGASSALNSKPERELQAAYNMLIHLISQAPEPDPYIARLCKYLTQPITSSPQNGAGLALGILSTIFNTTQPDDETRFHILLAIIDVIKSSGNFVTLEPQLKNVDSWVQEWELEPAEARKLYLAISDAAAKSPQQSYFYLLKALKTIQDDASSQEAHDLSIRALKLALESKKHFDFQDLTAFESIQALRTSDPTWMELLEIFSSENYDDFQDFKEANGSFLSDNKVNESFLDEKMRKLTLASLAAQASSTRTLPYEQIAKALQVPVGDVERWVIDSIQSGLIEGKLSQQKQEFLIHRSTYRVFGENQWREVASRLETWKSSLTNVLAVIRAQKEEFITEKEAEVSGAGVQNGQGYRPGRGQRNAPERSQQQAVEVE